MRQAYYFLRHRYWEWKTSLSSRISGHTKIPQGRSPTLALYLISLINVPQLEYAFEYLWALSISAVKLSVLFFYRRLFPRENTSRHWRICHYTLCGASICFGVISLFGGAFQCAPVAYLWDKAIPGGTCIDFIAFARFTSIFNIVTDILILALPIPIVWQLHLERSKKIGVIGLFLLGGL